MFVYESMNRNMYFLDGKIKTLHTNDARVNIKSDNIPQTIEINYILERTWCAPGYESEVDDYFIVRNVKYRVVQNIDWSLSLFPDPSDVQKLISEQMNLWKQWTNDIWGLVVSTKHNEAINRIHEKEQVFFQWALYRQNSDL